MPITRAASRQLVGRSSRAPPEQQPEAENRRPETHRCSRRADRARGRVPQMTRRQRPVDSACVELRGRGLRQVAAAATTAPTAWRSPAALRARGDRRSRASCDRENARAASPASPRRAVPARRRTRAGQAPTRRAPSARRAPAARTRRRARLRRVAASRPWTRTTTVAVMVSKSGAIGTNCPPGAAYGSSVTRHGQLRTWFSISRT